VKLISRIAELEKLEDQLNKQSEDDANENNQYESKNENDDNHEGTKDDESKTPTEEQNTDPVNEVKANDTATELPRTATSIYRYLLLGILILVVGGSLALYNHRRTN